MIKTGSILLFMTMLLSGCPGWFSTPTETETSCTGGSSSNSIGAPAEGGDGKDEKGNLEPLVGGGTTGTGGSCTTKTKMGESQK